MSFFDQPYYALTKMHMSRMGIWPYQSKFEKIVLLLTMFLIILTLAVPGLIRLYDTWRDINILARSMTGLLMAIAIFDIVLSCLIHVDNMKLVLNKIEEHWQIFINTPAVIVLEKCAEQGRYITVIYSTCSYFAVILCFGLCLSPIVLDFFDPLNETRPKIYMLELEYGVEADKYYWFIMAHTYIVVTVMISLMVAVGTFYILGVVHACALFEVVGFNLELIAKEYTVNESNAITLRIDWNYNKISNCIILHSEAISFAERMEYGCYGSCGVVLATMTMIIVISGVQALINWDHPEVLAQQATMIIGQSLHLYLINIPGQELINRSGKIHTTAYNLDWYEMSTNTRKLLIPILIRSNKPCYFTAGKIHVLSMETFGSALRIVISYFTIFAQMI